ncbi:hypothetical protein CKO36_19135 [Rhabdochromatium marinum]|nr:hypothetical protein [Rhabdochromatium marinum]
MHCVGKLLAIPLGLSFEVLTAVEQNFFNGSPNWGLFAVKGLSQNKCLTLRAAAMLMAWSMATH